MPPIYTKVYVLLALYASWHTILGDIQYMPPIYTNIFISQHYMPAGVLHQGTSSIYRLYILVFISQHYANVSSGNYTPAARLYLGMPRLRRLQVPNYIYPSYIRRTAYLVESRLYRLYLPRYVRPLGIIRWLVYPLYPRLRRLQLPKYTRLPGIMRRLVYLYPRLRRLQLLKYMRPLGIIRRLAHPYPRLRCLYMPMSTTLASIPCSSQATLPIYANVY